MHTAHTDRKHDEIVSRVSCLRALCALCALWLAVSTPVTALAQGQPLVRGDVVLADDRTPASGAIVEVTDTLHALVARALTTDRGTFSIALPRNGRYGARVLRIGFRPTVVPPFEVAPGEPRSLHIVLTSEPIRLGEVRVAGEDACRIRADSGQLVAQVWEETRKALTSTRLGQPGGHLTASGLSYRSVRDIAGRVVLWQSLTPLTTVGARPFVSASVDSLARLGYATVDAGGTLNYYGPDADALISDEFAAAHCFRLLPPPHERPAWIGVGFRPVRDRKGITDIAGTFWVDRSSAELRLLEYLYTNVPPAVERSHAGGRIEFVRLASGDWLTNRWTIRAPSAVERRSVVRDVPAARGPRPQRMEEVVVSAVNVAGGEALSVERGGEELYHGWGIAWDAVLASRAGAAGAAEATVEFPDAGYFAAADSAGRVHLDHVEPGRHAVLISTWAMRALGLDALRRTIEIAVPQRPAMASITARPAALDTLALPTDEQLLVDRCGKDAVARGRALVVGTLEDEQHAPIEFDTLFVRWIADAARDGAAGRQWLVDSVRLSGGEPPREKAAGWLVIGSFGRWYVCGVPRSSTVRLTLERSGGRATLVHEEHIGPSVALVALPLTSTRLP